MYDIKIIDIQKEILLDNDKQAEKIRKQLTQDKVFMVNLMASPGSGKTSLIIQTIRRLREKLRIGVIEGDIDSIVDAEKIVENKAIAVQIQTGGSCHLDASMVSLGLDKLHLDSLDMVFIENIGNLVCPASFDTGADIRVMILSVPEGDDKPLKYPLIFSVSDALVINKTDYLPDPGFDVETLKKRARRLNPEIAIFEVSCRNEKGLEDWTAWLYGKALQKMQNRTKPAP